MITTTSKTPSAQVYHHAHVQLVHKLHALAQVGRVHVAIVIVYIDKGELGFFQFVFFYLQGGWWIILFKIHLHIQRFFLRPCDEAGKAK